MFARLFGKKAPLSERAQQAFDAADFGNARLLYMEMLDKNEGDTTVNEARINACLDALVEARLSEARRYIEAGETELADEEIANAEEIARTETQRLKIANFRKDVDGQRAIDEHQYETPEREDQLALMQSAWTEAQEAEYSTYGDAFLNSLLAYSSGEKPERSLRSFLDDAEKPRYLYLELAREAAALENTDGVREYLHEFIQAVPLHEAEQQVFGARVELAFNEEAAGNFEKGADMIQTLIDANPESQAGYLAMGRLLRQTGATDAALEVLRAASEIVDDFEQRDWRLLHDLGMTAKECGVDEEAIHSLEEMLEFFLSREADEFPTLALEALAELHHNHKNPQRAADIYAILAHAKGHRDHASYYLLAANELQLCGLDEEAARLAGRAIALLNEAVQNPENDANHNAAAHQKMLDDAHALVAAFESK